MVQLLCRPAGALVVSLAVLASAGCPAAVDRDGDRTVARPLAGTDLKVAVVSDERLAEAIRRLSGEWNARTGGTYEVATVSAGQLAAGRPPEADLFVYPSHQLGLLAERAWIAPLPPETLAGAQLAWSDVLELVRLGEVLWGAEIYAVPFGSPVLVCYYRADLLRQTGKRPPTSWKEYHQLAEFFSRRDNLGAAAPPAEQPWFGAAEPLGEGWAGVMPLARAAAYAKHPNYYSTLFDMKTMTPRIADPPLVRALEELAATARNGPPDAMQLSPTDVRRLFRQGRCALAISWPSAADVKQDAEDADSVVEAALAELPGAQDVFEPEDKTWDDRRGQPARRVALVGVAGRLGSVARQSARADAARALLVWLAGPEWSAEVSAASPATTLFRRAHVTQPLVWIEPYAKPNAARQFAETLKQSLSAGESLDALRIPGRERYLAALDHAVHQAVRGDVSAEEALRQAATEWSTITEELGVEAQRAAYQRSLGLVP